MRGPSAASAAARCWWVGGSRRLRWQRGLPGLPEKVLAVVVPTVAPVAVTAALGDITSSLLFSLTAPGVVASS